MSREGGATPSQALSASRPTGRPYALALRPADAARALGLSDESFDRYVKAELPVVRIGSMRLYRVEALNAWLRQHESPSPAEDVR